MSRRKPPRRGRKALISLLVAGALAGAGAAFYFLWWSSGTAESFELTVRYRTDAPAKGAVARPWLEVVNTSDRPVDLSEVTLRYYYTADGGSAYASNCVQTSLGCSQLTQRTAAADDAAPQADHYLEIGFRQATGTLKPGGSTHGIGLQLYRVDHKDLDQADDRSFDADDTTYTPSKRVTAYLGGALVWGEEPNGDTPAPAGSPAPKSAVVTAAAPALPRGVLFDDFDYTGPGDPALAAHGWEVRDGAGGPGIKDTWSKDGVSFPAREDGPTGGTAAGVAGGTAGQVLQLRAETDGTAKGTRQSEFHSTRATFFEGTLVARIHLSDKPSSGADGDHIAESFFTISPDHESKKYSELDFEYLPNGGWGAYGPRLDTTSWRNSETNDRVTKSRIIKLGGWHTMVITAHGGRTTYSLDGRELFTSGSRYSPREPMTVNFSNWFIDLPFKGARGWDMKVDWLYCRADQAVSGKDAQQAVAGLTADGTHYMDTLSGSKP
ncbi:cellulose binding domain-containing protein [Streptomyces sp. ME02-8801-2C]|uniref:cellulose binding domain-containing protein n=1 Tax=Streptomyces sp. ME02-8801-2C TaxID=3028680 RepID=UPI0029BA3C1E|nr:cellulose binding domain-containing protein [Streptomyces sp. ME02-8801-2C]MDX3455782.1 cellulose binding domain-containing protein [Streptomyces sp. ME02-8801-2C]